MVLGFDSVRGHHGFVARRMDFDSELFRMSAIAKATYPTISVEHDGSLETDSENYFVYTKGSPEHMRKIFLRESVPTNYNEIVNEYASQGLRVLAIGHRKLN